MGLLDSILGSVLGSGSGDKQNMLVQIASSLITKNNTGNGLAGLAQQFDQKGLGDLMQSWISTGQNKAISPGQMQHALGAEQIQQFAKQTGMQGPEVSSALSALLPQMIDKLTPKGRVPQQNDLQGMLTGLLGSLGK
jgi:uncharacterized protein YidB (DUF937 family)